MIVLTKLRELNISAAAAGIRPLHLSAASGLVCLNSIMYVVADDELHLGVFSVADRKPGHLIRVFDGVLPGSKAARKRQKPDLEALAFLPAFRDFPHGALLAFGSGSRPNRRRGVLLGLDPHGVICGSPRSLDLSPILVPLNEEFSEVNIEGVVVVSDELRLFQRGNKGQAGNAIIRFQLSTVLDALQSERIGAIKPSAISRLDLGSIHGVPFSFTDAAALPNGDMVFSAVAEDTEDAFRDGPCIGALIGIADNNGDLRSLHRFDRPYKIEGIDARLDGNRLDLLLVTDADNPDIPAVLLSSTMNIPDL
ncbi:DUF6929 family protein [Ensifer sp. 4252]|uniref:DUF6929 family protein n=1 Tax=Ensifer sp. 4252 TaxID=3373915 RepID=UPI003D1B5155